MKKKAIPTKSERSISVRSLLCVVDHIWYIMCEMMVEWVFSWDYEVYHMFVWLIQESLKID